MEGWRPTGLRLDYVFQTNRLAKQTKALNAIYHDRRYLSYFTLPATHCGSTMTKSLITQQTRQEWSGESRHLRHGFLGAGGEA